MDKKNGIQIKSADTSIIENRLRNTKPGDIVTYAELSTLLGRDVREFCRGSILTARKALVNESIFFDCVMNEGLKRLTESEAVKAADSYRKKIGRTARKGVNHLGNIQSQNLTDEEKRRLNAMAAQFGAADLFTSGKATKKIEAAIVDASHKMAIGETMKLFGG